MEALSKKLWSPGEGLVSFWCPGCDESHAIRVEACTLPGGKGYAVWGWDKNVDAPTFTPSILIRSGHHAPRPEPTDHCWCTYNAAHPENPAPFVCSICHSFVREGKIQFLSDSTHKLSGQTVDIPEWDGKE